MKIIENNKFKSTYLTINYIFELNKKEVTENIIWATSLLKATNDNLKTIDIERKFASLYSSSYGVSVEKFENLFLIQFRLEVLNKKYLPKNEDVFEEALKLLTNIIYNPLVINGGFDKKIVEKQKNIIRDRINAKKDDKRMYALNRCEELLSENPEDIYLYGRIEDLPNINEKTAYKQYRKVMENAHVEVIVNGSINKDTEEIIKKYVKTNNITIPKLMNISNDNYDLIVEKTFEEKMTQSILTQGMKIKNYDKKDVYKYILYNAILGSGTTSKLFQNVREKASLAYYTFSRFNRFTGKIIICTGIEPKNYKKAINLVNKQLDIIKNGDITDSEFNTAKKLICNNVKEWNDSQYTIDTFYLTGKIFYEKEITFDEFIEEISKVTKQDVIEISKNVVPKVIYSIGGKENV